MKKLINLPMSDIEYVYSIAQEISDNQFHKHGNFSKAIRFIIKEYKDKLGNR